MPWSIGDEIVDHLIIALGSSVRYRTNKSGKKRKG
jgi:hypothetical protein